MLKIGDKVYEYNEPTIGRERISKIDENGVEWFSYKQVPIEDSIIEHTVIGIVTCKIVGEFVDPSEFIDSYQLESKHNKLVITAEEVDSMDCTWSYTFYSSMEKLLEYAGRFK